MITILPTLADSDRPWLVWYARSERTEFTGRVLSMWHSKAAGLIAAESSPGSTVQVTTPPHWRTMVWCAGAWLAGRPVLLGSRGGSGDAGEAPGVSVAFDQTDLDQDAEAQVLVPRASLALHWPGELPALAIDGVADLMALPDHLPAASTHDGAPALVTVDERGRRRALTRADLVAGLPPVARSPRPVLVRETTAEPMARAVLAAWRAGRGAVIVCPRADDALARAAARQEGAIPL